MSEGMETFMANWGWHLVQLLTLIIVGLVKKAFGHLLTELKALRREVREEHERFKDYVQEEKCKMHRELIEKHIADSEARIERMLSHCKHHRVDSIG